MGGKDAGKGKGSAPPPGGAKGAPPPGAAAKAKSGGGSSLTFKEKREKEQRELEEKLTGPEGFAGKAALSPEEEEAIAKGGKETAGHEYAKFKPTCGHFACKRCGVPIYKVGAKLVAAAGWPVFDLSLEGAIQAESTGSSGHVELFCAGCGAFLGQGHVELARPGMRSGQRHVTNGLSLQYLRYEPRGVPRAEVELSQALLPPKEERLGVVVERGYRLECGTRLCISSGSVVHFQGDALVNASNEMSLSDGGGVNLAVSKAGGPMLAEQREALPLIATADGREVRIPVGEARLTNGKGAGSTLEVTYCIHAVGPDYERERRAGRSLEECDELLQAAYRAALAWAQEPKMRQVAFTLLSAGIFRGEQTLEKVLRLAVEAVRGAAFSGLEEVHLVAFNDDELWALLAACDETDW